MSAHSSLRNAFPAVEFTPDQGALPQVPDSPSADRFAMSPSQGGDDGK